MMFDGVLSWFRASDAEVVQETSWDPVTLTMIQPRSPVAPTTDEIITDQPILGEGMDLRLRGGDSNAVSAVAAAAVSIRAAPLTTVPANDCSDFDLSIPSLSATASDAYRLPTHT
ncbi:uncharacterized protein BO97DRAFT_424488 [Aspergillus homomorphus CBS 101889]|uniref:Uncharacterized protein n=1 Tax=Aspergillus homomorphus (strain CBS 101889) TaxID=1450537 RepID=A0A395HX87_ASPHC|nr:hypothetical protein BO97DRAFT_424488 [Aspergillus homomorphus CBS 101889]RAL12400.1 hypothetical protein BO97DRAFT_424488 [Aspergillus homomorphus CBS 101889]